MNLINKKKKEANPNWCKNIGNIFCKFTYFFLVVKLSIIELKQLFTLTFPHDAKKYVLKLRTQLVFLRKRRHFLVPVFLGFSRRKKRFASSHLNQPNVLMHCFDFKYTHREKATYRETPVLTKNTNMDIWSFVYQINSF